MGILVLPPKDHTPAVFPVRRARATYLDCGSCNCTGQEGLRKCCVGVGGGPYATRNDNMLSWHPPPAVSKIEPRREYLFGAENVVAQAQSSSEKKVPGFRMMPTISVEVHPCRGFSGASEGLVVTVALHVEILPRPRFCTGSFSECNLKSDGLPVIKEPMQSSHLEALTLHIQMFLAGTGNGRRMAVRQALHSLRRLSHSS